MTAAERLEAERRKLSELFRAEKEARRSTTGIHRLHVEVTNIKLRAEIRARKRKIAA
jgi:hypothetical protein